MKSLNYLSPVVSSVLQTKISFIGRRFGRSFWIMNICAVSLPMLDWDSSYSSICFNPKKIPKVPNRKHRKACYQAFALYKKSFKPTPRPKLKIWRDEWPTPHLRAKQSNLNHATDSFAYFAHIYKERAKLAAQYECRWDLGE